jgi:hypothetical protein
VQANGGLCYIPLVTPIGLPIQRKFSSLGSQTATTVLSGLGGGAITVGQRAIIVAFSASGKVISSVADAVGNTWTVDYTFSDGTRTASFASCPVTTTIANLTNVTVTWSAATSQSADLWLFGVAGLAASPFDKSAGAGGSGTTIDSGATATLSQANEIAFMMGRTGGVTSWTKGAGWTDVATPSGGSTSSCAYQITSATTALHGTGTFGVSATWIAAVATYKGFTASL